ncbi:LysR family transcriptional regulator [Paraburkholderia bonniea]|uniref:LysR family transcriptional regulator n=1 Tax=Paraburkholderia bonniea TaxID=2152891 RepID=UPI0012911BFB|nr:LysR family transcriptional regulator [Paraburkholderia bonniea]WJF88943.1 LysR family transcriptional regulator [Paraburkholderia bonniea]WJF92259.1 LysR family transcriptional regulator [Paraburkholderia bonniea]
MDRFRQIETFVRVADAGSLAAAALEEGVSPVILGRRIDALERRLGVKLMYRSTRRLVISEEGAAFLERCRGLLREWNQAENELTEGRRAVSGHLVVSAPAAFGRKHVAPLASQFLADKPELQVSFNLSDRVADLVREGYDLSIRIGGSVDPNFVAVKLASNRRVVCGTPAYFEQYGRPQTLDDLRQHNCLAFNLQGGQNRGWYFNRHGRLVTVRVGGTLDCNDGELLHRWVSEGLGLGWRSTWEVQAQLARGELETVLDEFALPDYDILAVYPQQRYVPAKVRYFIDYLKACYAQDDYWNGAHEFRV